MDDFRLKVFVSVAQNQSFTKAANEVFISQPAVTNHIKNLESLFGARLFERTGNKVILTTEGEVLLRYAKKINLLFQEANFEISTLKKNPVGNFKLGASTTIAQYLIAPVLASFHDKFPKIELFLRNGNSGVIENAIITQAVDMGIVESVKRNANLKYTYFTSDELVLVVNTKSKLAELDTITLEELKSIPLVLRERGSGTLEVIEATLKDKNLELCDLNLIMHLGSSESIKSFLEHSNTCSFLSNQAIIKELRNGELKVITISDLKIKRTLNFVHLQGIPDGISTLFMKFALQIYNQK